MKTILVEFHAWQKPSIKRDSGAVAAVLGFASLILTRKSILTRLTSIAAFTEV